MHRLVKKTRIAINVAVATSTVAWSIGLSAFVPVAHAAVDLKSGDLIRASLTPAVYYYGADGKRYVFPNERTYKSWYADFSSVKRISDADLQAVSIGGNVTYRPGVRMVKITTDPKVYAVDAGGSLRWVKDEATAKALYGDDWNKKVDDIPDAFFVNYKSGAEVAKAADYDKAAITAAASAINVDKGLAAGTGETVPAGALSLSLASDTPPAASAPYLAGDVIFSKVVLSAGASEISIKSVKVTRYGLSADADLSSVKLYVGTEQQGTNQTFDAQHKATFALSSAIKVPANSSKTLTLAGDIAATGTAVSGNQLQLGIDSAADVNAGGSSVNGTFPIRGNTVSISGASIGTVTIAAGPDNPGSDSSPDAGKKDLKIFELRATAGSTEDVELTQVVFLKGGTHVPTDIKDLKLQDTTNAKLLATVAGWNDQSRAVFDLSPAIQLSKGNSVNLALLVGEVLAGSARTITATLEKSGTTFTGVRARGKTYNLGLVPTGAFAGTATAQTIAAGSLTVVKASTTPATGNIAPGGNDVHLASFDMVVRGESVRTTGSTTFALTLAVGLLRTSITACTLRDSAGNVVAGPVDANATPAVVYSTTMTFPVGTNTYQFRCNIGTDAVATGTVVVGITPSTGMTVQGVTSGNSISLAGQATAISGNTQTVQGPALAVRTEATPAATTIVAGQTSVPLANILFDTANSGENVRVTSVAVQNTRVGAGNDNSDWQNLGLYDESGARLSDLTQPTAGTAAGSTKTTITLVTPLVVNKATTKRLSLKADYKSGVGAALETSTWNVAAAGDIVATGVSTGTSVTPTVSGAGQAMTFAAAGTLTSALDAGNPTSDLIIAGQTNVPMLAAKLTASTEDIKLDTFKVTRTSTGQGADSDVSKVYLYDGTTKLGEGRLSAGAYTFDVRDQNVVVAKNGTKILTVKADFTRVVGAGGEEGAISGNQDRLSLTATTDLVAKGQASGSTINASAALTGNEMFLRRTKLTVARNASWIAPTTPAGAATEVFQVDLTATGAPGDAGAGVRFTTGAAAAWAAGDGHLSFAISQSGGTTTARTVSALRKKDNTTLDSVTYDLTTASGEIDINFSTAGLTVSAGDTETVILRADLTDYATTGEFFQLRLVAETSDTLAAADNVRYDDFGSTTGMVAGHVNGSHADFNGFRVPGLDLNGPVLKV